MSVLALCKFTPLGFETALGVVHLRFAALCKFTPLGFETEDDISTPPIDDCVNLPRWGLKPRILLILLLLEIV